MLSSAQPLESSTFRPEFGGISVRRSSLDEADTLAAISAREIGPNTASTDVVRRVMSFSTECFFTVLRSNRVSEAQEIIGFYAYLLLNTRGLKALLSDTFDGADPDITMLCTLYEQPVAIYGWAAVARGVNKVARPLAMRFLDRPRYRDLDFYSRGVTEAGIRALTNLGCIPARPGDEPKPGCLMIYRSNSEMRVV